MEIRFMQKYFQRRKTLIVVVGVLLFGIVFAAIKISWKLQPWMSSNQALELTRWRTADIELEIWQRKNETILEPFATGLFFRFHRTNQWGVVCLDHQDVYKPAIAVISNATEIIITRNGRGIGAINRSTGEYVRYSDGRVVSTCYIGGSPPGNWWGK